jgi:hypothetical protein
MLFGVVLASVLALGATDTAFARDKRCHDYDGRGYRPSGYDGRDAQISNRIAKDEYLIRRWGGTGRHEKVVRWAHEDIAKAQRNLDEYRYGGRRYDRVDDRDYYPYDRGYDRGYDPYDDRRDDPYYGSGSGYPIDAYGSFDIKRDWPYLLGGMLGTYSGR